MFSWTRTKQDSLVRRSEWLDCTEPSLHGSVRAVHRRAEIEKRSHYYMERLDVVLPTHRTPPTTSYTSVMTSLSSHPSYPTDTLSYILPRPTLDRPFILPHILHPHPSYPILPLPTPSYLILPSLTHPTLDPPLNHPTLSACTPSSVVSYCHPMRMWLDVVGGGRTGWGGKRLQRRMGLDEVGCGATG